MESIILDTDGVIRNFSGRLQEVYKSYHPDYEIVPITDYKLEYFYPKNEIYEFIYEKHIKEIFEDALPFEGALEFVKELKKNYHVILCSSQPNREAIAATIMWYNKHKVPFNDILFTETKWQYPATFLIDDSPTQIENAIKEKSKIDLVIPFIQPHNIKYLRTIVNQTNRYYIMWEMENSTPKEKYKILLKFFNVNKGEQNGNS